MTYNSYKQQLKSAGVDSETAAKAATDLSNGKTAQTSEAVASAWNQILGKQ